MKIKNAPSPDRVSFLRLIMNNLYIIRDRIKKEDNEIQKKKSFVT